MADPGPVAPTSGEDALLSLRELARRTGVSEGTLRRWAKEVDPPLRVRRSSGRVVGVTVADLRAFCAAHPTLRAAGAALARLDHPAADDLAAETLRTVLGAVVAAVRTTTAAQLDLAQTSAGQAQNAAVTCRDHAAALASALGGLDDALIRIAPPSPDPS